MNRLEFYFDYLSPYAYFAWSKVESFCASYHLELVVKPVVFGKLLDHWGQLGPAEVPPKREWLIKYCLFYAQKNKLPLAFPKHHPFNSLPALRASLSEVSGSSQRKLVSAIFERSWGKGADIGDMQVIANIAREVGLDSDAVLDAIASDTIKLSLKKSTDEAISKGVFGVPTMVYREQLFWGNDQFDYLSQCIKGEYQVNEVLVQDILARPRAVDRKR